MNPQDKHDDDISDDDLNEVLEDQAVGSVPEPMNEDGQDPEADDA